MMLKIANHIIDTDEISFVSDIYNDEKLTYDDATKSYDINVQYYLIISFKTGINIEIDDDYNKLQLYHKKLEDVCMEKS